MKKRKVIKNLHVEIDAMDELLVESIEREKQAESLSLAYRMALDDLILFAKQNPAYPTHALTQKARFVTQPSEASRQMRVWQGDA